MFENLSHELLQNYWWIIISLLGAIFVFLTFVQGGQTLIYQIGKNDIQRSMLINAIGRKWELTFTTLVTFGGAFFASFPLFYSTSFGGAYWVWMLILLGFILQAVSYEYRKKENNFLGEKTYEYFLFANGILATVLVGAAVSTFFTGSDFSVDFGRLSAQSGSPVISKWENPWHGLEAAFNFQNLCLGLAVLFVSRILATLYFINNINNNDIYKNSIKQLKINTVLFLVFFLSFVSFLLTQAGFGYNPETKEISLIPFKYFNNLIEMPVVLILFLLGVVLVLFGIYTTLFKASKKGINPVGVGVVLTVFSLFLLAGFNYTSFYPSTADIQSSLTIRNASSSHYTLTAMSYVSLFVPFVIAYIWYAWNAINKKKIDIQEIEDDKIEGNHVY